jgi:hypothetical protein
MTMSKTIYSRLRQKAREIAESQEPPSFYIDHEEKIRYSYRLLKTAPLVKRCRVYLDETLEGFGHGLTHAENVALDAGAIVQIEGLSLKLNSLILQELVQYAQVAGILHDIRRKDSDHALKGSIEAGKLLEKFNVPKKHRSYIVTAIRNHEAFKKAEPLEDTYALLISDALYDADKFRWGPENFTTTLWLMLESENIPFHSLYNNFLDSIRFIEKIKYTFRTVTGRHYGPEFIERGLTIGRALYRHISEMLSEGYNETDHRSLPFYFNKK